jgi:hypothetical protein
MPARLASQEDENGLPVATLSPSADGRGVGFFFRCNAKGPRLAEIRSPWLPEVGWVDPSETGSGI